MTNKPGIITLLKNSLPELLAIYAFGSRIQGTAHAESDLDLAVLVAGYADPLQLWALSSDLAELAGCPVDLLDLRAATTVMQYQVITQGECWWRKDSGSQIYEAAILSQKTDLDTARALLLQDIKKDGCIYG